MDQVVDMEGKRFEKRKEQAEKMLKTNKDMVPVIVRRSPKAQITELKKKRMLVPIDCTMGQFMHIIRKNIDLPSEEGLFVFINDCIPSSSATIGELYEQFHKDDFYLYITYSGESVYGGI